MGYRSRQDGQHLLEYTTLFCVIIASLLIMQVYVKRAYQGGLKQQADQLGQPYAPNHTASLIESITNVTSFTYTGGNRGGVRIEDGITLSETYTNTTYNKKEAVDSFAAGN